MLGQIEAAFDERTASEERLRRFVADASHELRTPLAAVRAYAELFGRGARERPDDLERVDERHPARVAADGRSSSTTCSCSPGSTRAGRSSARPSSSSDVARDAVEAARTLGPGRAIELDAPAPVVVEGDRERLRQVLDNLLANVRAHTPPGLARAPCAC